MDEITKKLPSTVHHREPFRSRPPTVTPLSPPPPVTPLSRPPPVTPPSRPPPVTPPFLSPVPIPSKAWFFIAFVFGTKKGQLLLSVSFFFFFCSVSGTVTEAFSSIVYICFCWFIFIGSFSFFRR
ncbi:hypothetical protein LguiA_034669 [Lonicera macranthoides]